MAVPPVPESPNRQLFSRSSGTPRGSSGTPRVGMHLYQNDEDDDDVSVLSFHTIGTKETINAVVSKPSFVKSAPSFVKLARESFERMILESKNLVEDDGKSLTRILEESGSQNSSCNSKSKLSNKSSSLKGDEEKVDEGNYNHGDDDDNISLAESILDSADKVLSKVGPSPYYTGRSRKLPTYKSSLPQPNPKQSPPMKQPTKNDTKSTENCSKNIYSTKKELNSSSKKISNEHDNQLELSSNFPSSYLRDENTKPSVNHFYHGKNGNIATDDCSYKSVKTINNNKKLQKLESETNHLQLLLKERQLETKKASQCLATSIKKAHELLRKYDAELTVCVVG